MDFLQRDKLQGFYAHCYYASHQDGAIDGAYFAKSLDEALIPWFIQNQVAHIASKRESIDKYFNTLLAEIVESWERISKSEYKRYILKASNGAFYTGGGGIYICSPDIEKALFMTEESANMKKANSYLYSFDIIDTKINTIAA